MQYWIQACDTSVFDVFSAFQKNEFIEWTQNRNYEIGDIVYIYCSLPLQRISHRCRVESVNLSSDNVVNSLEFWLSPEKKNEALRKNKFIRLRLLGILDQDISLKDVNIKRVQGPITLSKGQVLLLERIKPTNELETAGVSFLLSDLYKNKYSEHLKEEKIRKDFVENRFPLSYLKTMTIDDYVEGKSSTYKKSFCYLLEFRMQSLGQIRGTFVKSKFVINYSENNKKYEFQKGSKFGKTYKEVFENVRNEIVKLVEAGMNDDFQSIEMNRLPPMFKWKIYYVYYPEKTLPIYNELHLDFFIRNLGIQCDLDSIGTIEKKRMIIEWKNQSPVFAPFTNLEFMSFLYSEYGFKKETDILKKQEVSYEEEPEIVINKDLIDRAVKKSSETHRSPNFQEIQQKKTALGLSGEEYVLWYEKKHNSKYRKKIKRVGDDLYYGYDILSYDSEGNEKHIEVKTSNLGNINKIDFYLTAHEKEKLEIDDKYYIYYVCGMRGKKRMVFIFTKNNLENITFEPIAYKIIAKAKQ